MMHHPATISVRFALLLSTAFMMLVIGPVLGAVRQVDLPTQTQSWTDQAAQVELSLTSPDQPIAAGQPFEVTIVADAARESQVTLDSETISLTPYNLLELTRQPDLPTEQGRRFQWTLLLDSLEIGDHNLPAIELQVQGVRGTDVTLPISTQPVQLTIATSLGADPNAEELRDIRGLKEIHLASTFPWWAWLVIGIGLIIAITLAVWVMVQRRSTDTHFEAPPLLPADLEALAAIDQLASEELLPRALFHIFYTRLSSIVRRYIERRFAIMAPERTTDEFLRELAHQPILTRVQQDALEAFLRSADMVKFAKHQPLPQEGDAALRGARQFIEETKPHASEVEMSMREVA